MLVVDAYVPVEVGERWGSFSDVRFDLLIWGVATDPYLGFGMA